MSHSWKHIGGGALLISQLACSGKELAIGATEGATNAIGAAGAANAGGAADAGWPTTSDASSIVVSDAGWKWNVTCPRTIDAFCNEAIGSAMPCVKKWSEASLPATWCSQGLAPTMRGYCHGYWSVTVFPGSGMTTYYYDVVTGDLVHIDSDAIPSFTQCVAGVSNSRFDVFGCDYGAVTCVP